MPWLWADIVCRCQGKHLPVPEGGMVAGVVIGIAHQNIKNDTGKKFLECLRRFSESGADKLGELFITGITGHHFIQFQQGQCREDQPAPPPPQCDDPVKPFHQQQIFGSGFLQRHRRHIQTCQAGQAHGNELCLDDGVDVGSGGKFGDKLLAIPLNKDLWPSSPDGSAMV